MSQCFFLTNPKRTLKIQKTPFYIFSGTEKEGQTRKSNLRIKSKQKGGVMFALQGKKLLRCRRKNRKLLETG